MNRRHPTRANVVFPLCWSAPELWMRDLEAMRASLGVRCETIHVDPDRWLEHWIRARSPMDALLAELRWAA